MRIPTVHTCATTSLPDVSVCTERVGGCTTQCDEPDGTVVAHDLWYKFVIQDCTELLVNGCATGFSWDSVVAIYAGPEGTGVCPCPTDVSTCESVAFPGPGGTTAADDGCTQVAGPPLTSRTITRGTCYMLQFGASGSSPPGAGELDLHGTVDGCAFVPQPCENDFAEATNGANGERLSRFGCTKVPGPPTAAGTGTGFAFKVGLKTLYNTTPGDPDGADVCPSRTLLTDPKPSLQQFEGQVRYLGAPAAFFDDALPQAAMYIAAPLVCTPEEAAVRDWSPTALAADFPNADASRIYFWGDTVVPCSVYELSACVDPNNDATCVGPTIYVTAKTGDAWPPKSVLGQPGFVDINSIVLKYKGVPFTPGATPQGAPPEWHAFQNGNVFPMTGQLASFLDISVGVDSYKGMPYREQGPCNPDTGIDSCGKPCNTDP